MVSIIGVYRSSCLVRLLCEFVSGRGLTCIIMILHSKIICKMDRGTFATTDVPVISI